MGKDNEKFKLYAITTSQIFQRCFDKAGMLKNGLLEKSKWSYTLRDALKAELSEAVTEVRWDDYNNYLRDRYNQAVKDIESGRPKEEIGFYADNFSPLFLYLGYKSVEDVKNYNLTFDSQEETKKAEPEEDVVITIPEPVCIRALYTPSTFGPFDILRSPDSGFVYIYHNGDIVFEGEKDLFIRKSTMEPVSLHNMFGDKATWVKLEYKKTGSQRTAYFAEFNPGTENLSLKPDQLMKHLPPINI